MTDMAAHDETDEERLLRVRFDPNTSNEVYRSWLLDAVAQAVKARPLSCGHRDDEWIALERTCREQTEEILRLAKVRIDELARAIAVAWPFGEQYHAPSYEMSERHIVLHLAKDVGRLASVAEQLDHVTWVRDIPLRDRALRNILVSALRLCGVVGVSPAELIREYLEEPRG